MAKQVILYLGANPEGLATLRLTDEVRAIQDALGRGTHRDHFEFETCWSAQPIDLIGEIRRLRPTVVQFSGHSDGRGLFFEASDKLAHAVSSEALGRAFATVGASVRLVVLNACYSDQIAELLVQHVDCVVGMSDAVEDDDAIAFSAALYGALADGVSAGDAYEQACAQVAALGGSPDVARMRLRGDGAIVLVDGPPPVAPPRSIRQPSAFSGTTLAARIVELLQRVPGTASYAVRSEMLPPPLMRVDGTPLVFERDRDSARVDFELIVAQLENIGLPLVEELLHGCADRVASTELRDLLVEAGRQVRAYFDGERRRTPDPAAAPGGRPFRVWVTEPSVDGMLALDHLSEGNNASPAIAWSDPPSGTESFVVLMEDRDGAADGPRYHWVQHSIPRDVTALPRNAGGLDADLLGAGIPGRSDDLDSDLPGYHGPEPTLAPRRYHLSLLALSRADLPGDPTQTAVQLLRWIERRDCLLARTETVVFAGAAFSDRDFLFQGHPVLGRIFGGRASRVFAVFFALALVLLVLPAWLIHIDDLPPEGWTATGGGRFPGLPPCDNRGFFHQPNWIPIYLLAVPAFFAAAAWFAAQVRLAVRRIARCPGGVIRGVRELPFAQFVQRELARSARRTSWIAAAFALGINLIDTLPLIIAHTSGDFSTIRPYWAIAHLHARRVDVAQNVAFDVVAYLFQLNFTFLFAFITFKFLSFLEVLSRTVRGLYNAKGYVFAPSWHDPERRLGLGALGVSYTAFILLALAVNLFAFLHRIQLINEMGCGGGGYWDELVNLIEGDQRLHQLAALAQWSAMSTGFIAMMVALVIPLGVIAYFPLFQLWRSLFRQIARENDVFTLKQKLAKTPAERDELAARHQALKRTNVWPNGDAVAYGSLAIWFVLFGAAIYPPVLLAGGAVIGASGVTAVARKLLFPRAAD